MPNLFGYQSYPQRPSPNRREVGQALLLQRVGGGAQGAPTPQGGPFVAGTPPEAGAESAGVGDPAEDRLRRQGGRLMGGAGQMGWGSGVPSPGPEEDPNPSAIAAAVGEALTRMGGGIARAPSNPYVDRDRRRRDVLRLGISEFEADLLLESGGL